MDQGNLPSDPERRSLIRHPDRPASETGTSDALAFGADAPQWTPDSCYVPDEATVWAELETKKRSAEYHMGQVMKYGDSNGDSTRSQELARRNDRRVQSEDGGVHKDQWRLKIEHDKAVRDLLALQCILNTLKSENVTGRSTANAVTLVVIYSALFSAAYFLERHATRILYAMDEIAAFGTGFGVVYSTFRLCFLGLRMLAIGRCLRKVRVLNEKVQDSTVNQEDCASLRHSWFRILDWFRVDSWPASEQSPTNSGSPPSPPMTAQTSGYVIAED